MLLKNKLFFIISYLLSSLYTTAVFSALPPYYQDAKEIKVILDDLSVANKLGSGSVIESIIKIKNGYLIQTNKCKLEVIIIYKEFEGLKVGPIDFEVQLGLNDC